MHMIFTASGLRQQRGQQDEGAVRRWRGGETGSKAHVWMAVDCASHEARCFRAYCNFFLVLSELFRSSFPNCFQHFTKVFPRFSQAFSNRRLTLFSSPSRNFTNRYTWNSKLLRLTLFSSESETCLSIYKRPLHFWTHVFLTEFIHVGNCPW